MNIILHCIHTLWWDQNTLVIKSSSSFEGWLHWQVDQEESYHLNLWIFQAQKLLHISRYFNPSLWIIRGLKFVFDYKKNHSFDSPVKLGFCWIKAIDQCTSLDLEATTSHWYLKSLFTRNWPRFPCYRCCCVQRISFKDKFQPKLQSLWSNDQNRLEIWKVHSWIVGWPKIHLVNLDFDWFGPKWPFCLSESIDPLPSKIDG